MSKFTSLLAATAVFAVPVGAQNAPATAQTAAPLTAKRPNVILIVSDDQGYADAGFQGSKEIPTPSLDALAQSGVICTQGYVTFPVCSPSRAAFLAGRHGARFGYDANPDGNYKVRSMAGLPLTEQTMGDAMKAVGYKTGLIGKWHLGSETYFHPNERGFDEFFGFLSGGHKYMDWTPSSGYEAPILRNKEQVPDANQKYLTDLLSDEAVAFVDRHQSEPFFLYMAYNAPHTPLQAPKQYLDRVSKDLKGSRKTYAAMVLAMDDGIGRLRARLKELNLSDNTLIYFITDNGGAKGAAYNNAPLRGRKGEMWEGGIRVPFVVSWPNQIKAGGIYNQPVSSLDFLPTALAAAGGADSGKPAGDGVNLLPYLSGQTKGAPHDTLYWRHHNGTFAIREGDWKLVQEREGRFLFNIAQDIDEKNDLLKSNPQLAARLFQKWQTWNSANAAMIPWSRVTVSTTVQSAEEDD